MDKVIVYIKHDRHIDDVRKIYPYSEENLEKVKDKCRNDWQDGVEKHWGGFDYEFGWSEDYFSACEVCDVESI